MLTSLIIKLFHKTKASCVILTLLCSGSIYSQGTPDKVLENLINADDYEKAKTYTLKKLDTNLTDHSHVYYNAKVGFVYLRLGVIDSALFYSRKAIKNITNATPNSVTYEAWKSIAYSYTRIGKIDSATIYTQRLLTSVENTNNDEFKRTANTLMGIIHFQNKLHAESLNYYQNALELSLKNNVRHHLKVDYYNIGLAQTALKKYEEGIASLSLASSYALESKDKRLLARIYGTMADNYAAQNKDEKRQLYLNKANEIAQQIKDEKLIAMGQSHQLEWNFKNNRPTEAYAEGKKFVENTKTQQLPQIQNRNDSVMYVLAKQNNELNKALSYLESFHVNKIQLLRQNGKEQLAEIEARYQLKNKNLIIQKQELEVIATKRVNKITFLVATICFLLLLFFVYLYYKNKKLVHLIYNKEKDKDLEIKKLQKRIHLMSHHSATKEYAASDAVLTNDTPLSEINFNQDKLFEIYDKLMQLFEVNKIYLDPDLSQSTIVKLIGTNKKYLYESISKYSDLNFRGLINRFRINEAKMIIRHIIIEGKELHIYTIYPECGFNSNTSFYRTFKTLTGITPNEFAEEFRKDYSNRSIA